MAARSWFYASDGQQRGPFPEIQLRELIARGTITADTLVWTEGMANWQRVAEISDLAPDASRPPAMRRPGTLGPSPGGYSDGSLSIDLPVWDFLGRVLLLWIGYVFVIPAPWTGTAFYRWMGSRLQVPGRPDMGFTGQPGDIWYVFVGTALLNYAGAYDGSLQLIAIPISAVLSWILLRWLAGNLSSNGHPLPITFEGSIVTFVGWQVLAYVSFITIIGWAWVIAAWMRWICRNIGGTRRQVTFNGSGLEILWRTIVLGIGCVFLIPIPWALRWYNRWFVSQFELIERTA
jgi:hypothetical protein